MTKSQIIAAVDRGLEVRAQIATLKTELEFIQEALKAAGLAGDQLELKDEDREGRRYLARGTSQIVPVVFTADIIIGSFAEHSPQHLKARDAGHEHFGAFYKAVRKYENVFDDGKMFRARAEELLHGMAPRFVTACTAVDKHGIKKNNIAIQWDRAEPSTP